MPRLLIVDDDPTTLSNLSRWLEKSGYEVSTAPSAVAAMAIARRETIDAVITDLCMPELDGHGLLALIKELDPTIEVIMLSGYGTMEDAIAALSEGRAFHFLQKPLRDLQVLNLTIEKALLKRRCRQPHLVCGAGPNTPGDQATFSESESQIMALLAAGLDNECIAQRLFLSPKTVRNALCRVYRKLGVTNRMQAVIAWQSLGGR